MQTDVKHSSKHANEIWLRWEDKVHLVRGYDFCGQSRYFSTLNCLMNHISKRADIKQGLWTSITHLQWKGIQIKDKMHSTCAQKIQVWAALQVQTVFSGVTVHNGMANRNNVTTTLEVIICNKLVQEIKHIELRTTGLNMGKKVLQTKHNMQRCSKDWSHFFSINTTDWDGKTEKLWESMTSDHTNVPQIKQ